MKIPPKKAFAVSQVRRFLEPGPVVLVSSAYKGETNIMTLGWHMVMETAPSLIGCYIWDQNHSRELIERSKECVINVPTFDMAKTVVRIGNTSGREIDKFEKFRLTAADARKVGAPLVAECHAHFECRLADARMSRKYNFFVFEVVAAQAAIAPKNPRTIHYRGDGIFMVSGRNVSFRRMFRPEML
ncbi:MAG: flavin reductase family protein [Pseudorhodoplanes sp.]